MQTQSRSKQNGKPTGMNHIRRSLSEVIAGDLGRKGLSQTEVARRMNDAASQVSLVVNGKLRGFSTDRILRMLNGLGRNVDIVVRNGNGKRGKTQLVMGRNRD